MTIDELICGLPGEELVRQGLADRKSGQRTAAAYLVTIASPRLRQAGLISETSQPYLLEPEIELYRLLRQEGGDAYSRYNSLIRELTSFEAALDHRFSSSKR
jgi:hypothetical protein